MVNMKLTIGLKKGCFLFYPLVMTGLLIVFSVSCRKDDKTDHVSEAGSVADIDGNVYNAVVIGNQEWMAGNLRTTRYNDGSSIDNPGTDNVAWENNTRGAYTWYNNDEASYKDAYGALYNWHAVNTGKLCPAGWRVPSDEDWTTLNRNLPANAGGKLKETGTGHWKETDIWATNESGFTALPGGVRLAAPPGNSGTETTGRFYFIGRTGRWWSSSESSSANAWYRSIHFNSGNLYRSNDYKEAGFSVRCVRDLK